MKFVDLSRRFSPIYRDQEVAVDAEWAWAPGMAGVIDWPELLKKRRVVLLAEASCGKSEEFRHQQLRLAAEGNWSFFVSIEDLADHGLDASLGPEEAAGLRRWKAESAKGIFFLDSVDEARLNRKSFNTALRHLARELESHLGRAHFFISCRVSDWRGRPDRDTITQYLPVPPPPPHPPPDPETALLSPIFENKEKEPNKAEAPDEADALLVVQLIPLDTPQRYALAQAADIKDTDAFMVAIYQRGLEVLAERPGDLLDLIEYWRAHGRFGSFAEMTEHAITRKLAERDKYRADNDALTAEQARKGAERIAAALTLAQTFTIKAPAQDTDPTLASSALDADQVLPDFNESERNALLRRSCFAPSTYGRIRFHHRGTQEFLTACWFDGLLNANCPKDEVWSLFFADRYGVETVTPSMRPAAAWLALKHQDFMDEVIRREPLVLIQNGDPGSVPLHAKRKLLTMYAKRHATGDIADGHMDYRAIWMFAQPELAAAIKQAWSVNTRQDFRRDLLRMIQEAKITTCAGLAREALGDLHSGDYTRVTALAALAACEDAQALAAAAAHLIQSPEDHTPRLASRFSEVLFPSHLGVSQLLHIIEKSRRPCGDSVEGFPHSLELFYRACPDNTTKNELLAGLGELATRPPFIKDSRRISSDYAKIAENLGPIARIALEAMPETGSPTPALIKALMAIERAEYNESVDEGTPLSTLVRSKPQTNRALFWADVEEVRAEANRGDPLIDIRQVYVHGHCIWELAKTDLNWLKADLVSRENVDDQRIALSAIVHILRASDTLEDRLAELRASIAGQALLEEDLASLLAPPAATQEETEFQRLVAERQAEAACQEEQDKESWRQFCVEITANPERLRDSVHLGGHGILDLMNLTRWLRDHTGHRDSNLAALQWQQLSVGFSRDVADAYRDGMCQLWRIVAPKRPERREGAGITKKWANIFSFAGISIEASVSTDWASRLAAEDAITAMRHACYCEEGYPDWFDSLLQHHTESVLPVIQQELQAEWSEEAYNPGEMLRYFAYTHRPIPKALQKALVEVITASNAPNIRKAELGLRILQNAEWDELVRCRVARAATSQLEAQPSSDCNRMLLGLALLFLVDGDGAFARLKAWIDAIPIPQRKACSELALAGLFGRNHAMVPAVLAKLPTPILSKLASFAYINVSPEDDVVRAGTYTPDTRDNAEGARNEILRALLDRPGEEAYQVVKRLSEAGIAGISRTRFRKLARGKAERDSEIAPWQPSQVVAMETQHTTPIRSADDLMRVLMSVLADIKRDLGHEDASLRKLVLTADSEEQIQNWLAAELRLRAKGRFHVHREVEVADKNEPDIVISAIGAPVELAIEVKHGRKKYWTVRKLEAALTKQLVTKYLRTAARRHGILVITHHGNRTWRAPEDKSRLHFDALIERLQVLADTLRSNVTGPVKASVVGIDATLSRPVAKGGKKPSSKTSRKA